MSSFAWRVPPGVQNISRFVRFAPIHGFPPPILTGEAACGEGEPFSSVPTRYDASLGPLHRTTQKTESRVAAPNSRIIIGESADCRAL